MAEILHLNCGLLETALGRAACHCVALHDDRTTILIDTGIGLQDVADPVGRLGKALIGAAGFRFEADRTAARQIAARGVPPETVRDIVLTHADPDHTGGLADFPTATVHISAAERAAVHAGGGRYVSTHFAHGPAWRPAMFGGEEWFGFGACAVPCHGRFDVRLVELPGHTRGHCGVAVAVESGWLLHVGDAYYLRAELDAPEHPVTALAEQRADDNRLRLDTLDRLRALRRDHGGRVTMFGYHDETELPNEGQNRPAVR